MNAEKSLFAMHIEHLIPAYAKNTAFKGELSIGDACTKFMELYEVETKVHVEVNRAREFPHVKLVEAAVRDTTARWHEFGTKSRRPIAPDDPPYVKEILEAPCRFAADNVPDWASPLPPTVEIEHDNGGINVIDGKTTIRSKVYFWGKPELQDGRRKLFGVTLFAIIVHNMGNCRIISDEINAVLRDIIIMSACSANERMLRVALREFKAVREKIRAQ